MTTPRILGVFALLLATTVAAPGRADVGAVSDEFLVNTFTTNPQYGPATVITNPAGDFVVVWSSYGQDGDGYGVFLQRFGSDGSAVGPEFQVNTYTTGSQVSPAIASDGAGNFVVVWVSDDFGYGSAQDGSYAGVFGQRFASNGTPLGNEFQVNAYTPGRQFAPAIAEDSTGNFVVTWQSGDTYYGSGPDGSAGGVFVRRFDSAGDALTGDEQVNTHTAGSQQFPRVATTSDGGFVVVWSGPGASEADAVSARRFDAGGTAATGEFQVSTGTVDYYASPVVAADGAGRFVVAWVGFTDNTEYEHVIARRFGLDGSANGALGIEFRVDQQPAAFPTVPAISADAAGDFVVAWRSYGTYDTIRARTFGSNGAATSGEFQVNTTTSAYIFTPAVSIGADQQFVVSWASYDSDGDYAGILARRFVQGVAPSTTTTSSTTTTTAGATTSTSTTTSTTHTTTTTHASTTSTTTTTHAVTTSTSTTGTTASTTTTHAATTSTTTSATSTTTVTQASTTTSAPVTTTTIAQVSCETISGGAAAVCVLDRDREPDACDGQVPSSITTRLDQARALALQLDAASTPKAAKKLFKKARKPLAKVKSLAKKASKSKKNPISVDCATALRTLSDHLVNLLRP